MRLIKKILTLFKKPVKQIPYDAFLKRLRCTVIGEGMLHEGNIYLMDYAIKNMPENGITFEIGVYGGLSTNVILHLLTKNNKSINHYGCDLWVYEGYEDYLGLKNDFIDGRKDIKRKDYMNYIKEAFINSTKFLNYKNLPYTCHLSSNDFFNQWNNNIEFTDVFQRNFKLNQKIAFAYIDGDHSFEQTKKDFENVDSKLLIGGYILIDDSADYLNFGSAKFAKEILKNPNYKLIDKNPNYLFQKIK